MSHTRPLPSPGRRRKKIPLAYGLRHFIFPTVTDVYQPPVAFLSTRPELYPPSVKRRTHIRTHNHQPTTPRAKVASVPPPPKKKKPNFPPLLVCVSTHDIYPSRLNAIVTSPQSTVQGLLIHKRGRSLHKMAGLTGSSSISQVLGFFLTHGGKRHR